MWKKHRPLVWLVRATCAGQLIFLHLHVHVHIFSRRVDGDKELDGLIAGGQVGPRRSSSGSLSTSGPGALLASAQVALARQMRGRRHCRKCE